MDKLKMERRDFLKLMGSLIIGLICLPFVRLFRAKKDRPAASPTTREAMYYKSGDSLAG
ncbi:MAG: hypothetical protein JW847_09500 [Candidatus Omnitrophica bacterium]|nr:hypothetical protein [Candidatus Omnitrophota bacterium]